MLPDCESLRLLRLLRLLPDCESLCLVRGGCACCACSQMCCCSHALRVGTLCIFACVAARGEKDSFHVCGMAAMPPRL